MQQRFCSVPDSQVFDIIWTLTAHLNTCYTQQRSRIVAEPQVFHIGWTLTRHSTSDLSFVARELFAVRNDTHTAQNPVPVDFHTLRDVPPYPTECYLHITSHIIIIIIIIYPLTRGSLGHHIWFHKLPPFFLVLHCPLGLGELQACPVPNVVFPPLPLSAFSSSPFHCALQDGFGQTWWTEDMAIPLQFASLYGGQGVFVWSNCLLDLGKDFLVGNMVFVLDA